jgi:hypothetical protein
LLKEVNNIVKVVFGSGVQFAVRHKNSLKEISK